MVRTFIFIYENSYPNKWGDYLFGRRTIKASTLREALLKWKKMLENGVISTSGKDYEFIYEKVNGKEIEIKNDSMGGVF